MLHAIDADTHLFESTQVWDFLDEEMYPRRPIIVSGPKDTVYRRSGFWLIDGNIFPKSAGKGGFLLGTPTEPGQLETTPDVRARELLDIPGRLQAMDLMGSRRRWSTRPCFWPTLPMTSSWRWLCVAPTTASWPGSGSKPRAASGGWWCHP